MKLSANSVERIVSEVMGATLGDPRRNRRAMAVVERMARAPSAPLPQALGSDAQVQGCYRLMNNPEVSYEALHAAHGAATAQRARSAGRALALHDTTPCTFEHVDPEELGYLNTGKAGFYLHYTLVLDGNVWKRPLGVIHFEPGYRKHKPRSNRSKTPKKPRKTGTQTAQQQDKEFDRWWRAMISAHEALGGTDVTHIADRESDSYELMAKATACGLQFIFRSRTDRRGRRPGKGDGPWSTVKQIARGCEGLVLREVPLTRRAGHGPPAQSKVHPPRAMRLAKLRFAATRVEIPRPQYLKDPVPRTLTLNLVHVVEEDAPPGEQHVEWLLYTTRPIDTVEQVVQIVDDYRSRWTIEEFNAAFKTGCAYEAREFESRHALLNMLALSLPIACELLWLRSRARSTPEAPASDVLTRTELDVLRHLSSYKLPAQPTANDALLAVAALGGHLRRNGPPGWKVLAAGMRTLHAQTAGWEAALRSRRHARDL